MCLLVLAVAPRPDLRLVVLANRDEYHARPTQRLHAWDGARGVVGGADLEGGGTWLGVTPELRFAALTNVRDLRDLGPKEAGERSRGELVRGFLLAGEGANVAAERAAGERAMRGFNLVVGDGDGRLWWSSNRAPAPAFRPLGAGVHAVSNALLDTPWPKVERAKRAIEAELARPGPPDIEALMAILADRHAPPDHVLPDTGVGIALERALAPICVVMPGYGTRSSTVIVARADGTTTIVERTLAPEALGDVRLELSAGAAVP